MESFPVKKLLQNDSFVKVTYTFESEDFKKDFVSAFHKLDEISIFPIGHLQVHDEEKSVIIIETRFETMCSIFYIMGALAERNQKFKISLN